MFGRRTIYIYGQLIMGACLVSAGLCALYEWNLASFISLCCLVAGYQLSQGSVAWYYVSEVTVDAASGFCVSAKFVNLMIISFTFEFMINSPLQITGTIWYYAAWTLAGCIFCIVFVKETRGLTDIEKKTLYSPKSTFEDEMVEMYLM